MAVSFIGGGNRSTRRKPLTCCKSLTNCITYCCIEYTSPWTLFERTTFVVMCTDCTGSCQSNYHTTMTTTATQLLRVSDNINSLNMYIDKTQLYNLLCSFQIDVYQHNTHFCSSNISCQNSTNSCKFLSSYFCFINWFWNYNCMSLRQMP